MVNHITSKWEGQLLPISEISEVLVLSTQTSVFLLSYFQVGIVSIIQWFKFSFSCLYKGRLWRQWTLQIRSISDI